MILFSCLYLIRKNNTQCWQLISDICVVTSSAVCIFFKFCILCCYLLLVSFKVITFDKRHNIQAVQYIITVKAENNYYYIGNTILMWQGL